MTTNLYSFGMMKAKLLKYKYPIFAFILVLIILSTVIPILYSKRRDNSYPVTTYDECIREGGEDLKIFPPTCTLNGKSFAQETFSIKEVNFKVMAQGTQSSYSDKKGYTEVIDNKQEYKDLQDKKLQENEKLPDIDFSKNIVIALFQGQKPSGGYSVTTKKISYSTNTKYLPPYTVDINYFLPGSECFNTEAITSPFQVIEIAKPKDYKKVGFVFSVPQEIIKDCN